MDLKKPHHLSQLAILLHLEDYYINCLFNHCSSLPLLHRVWIPSGRVDEAARSYYGFHIRNSHVS